MKDTGIVRKIDNLGRIVLPIELRRTLGIEEGTPVEIYTSGDTICLRKQAEKICVICNEEKNLLDVDGICICAPCGRGISNAIAKEHLKRRK